MDYLIKGACKLSRAREYGRCRIVKKKEEIKVRIIVLKLSITRLALGTSSCSAFILSAIRSLLNCPHFIFTGKAIIKTKYSLNKLQNIFNNAKHFF